MVVRGARDLEIDEDLAFERRSLLVERLGLALMVALVVAAALGLLGSGPLNRRTTTGTGGLTADYPRVSRYQSSEMLILRLDAAATAGPEARLWLDRAYLDGVHLEGVLPPPVRVEGGPDRLVFVFAIADRGRPLNVRFELRPERIGPVRGRAGPEGRAVAAGVVFRQLVLP